MARSSKRTRVFISYSHKDAGYLERLHAHLAHYEHNGLVDFWDDTRLSAGDEWKQKIAQAIEHARVCILLVSADYLASAYVADNELPHMLARVRNDGVQILQVILSPCAFEHTELGQFQAINDASRPLSGMSRHNRETVWQNLTNKVVDALQETQPDEQTPPQHEPSKADGGGIEDMLAQGSSLIAGGRYLDAAEILQVLVDLTPENFRARFLYGVVLLKQGYTSAADTHLTHAFKLDYRQSTVVQTVLVVEDDSAMRSLFRSFIEDVLPGYAVDVASDGLEALGKLAHTKPALLLLDYMMPRMDGLEALHRLAERGDRYPVIFTSAHAFSAADIAERTGYPAKQVAFLPKPFVLPQLKIMLLDMIKRSGVS